MNTYIIGDVQGCFDSLQALLQKIPFHANHDTLGFVGDLVNRGPKSLETLRFIAQLHKPCIVLGNHDLHLLALYFVENFFKNQIPHTLDDILHAPDCRELIDFLLQQPFLHIDTTYHITLVHAGIPPQWSLSEAMQYAQEISLLMQKNPAVFFKNLYGNLPNRWHTQLTGWDRTRYIVNAFTRMRFCTQDGTLDLENKLDVSHSTLFRPWFNWKTPEMDLAFGHWASLKGRCSIPTIFALDTGCVWGGQLTALRASDRQFFQIDAREKQGAAD